MPVEDDGSHPEVFAEPENGEGETAQPEIVETFGGDEVEEVEEADAERRRRSHSNRHYKIQEVVKRRQIMLVQVAKEERGNKGAALTTYLSLAGRYCVLMPNTNRGGGVSRKITSIADRRRLKDILEELEIPEGMGVIVRTAGAERSKAEIRRDYEYLLRLWNEIRELTLNSTAPALIYEEGNLIKRSIRDLYTRDLEEVLVEGEEGYKTAKAFMRTLMPSHAKRVQPYRDTQVGLFHRFQIESQIDAIHSPVAQLRSGGYIVINQTEALVAIDVNSGRSTRERNIEETALRTNLEAAEELGRQLRLRDLAGLIVIDFIDMEEHRNQVAVERRLKEALKNDRARIQVGRISAFGLLEMSRQRLRPSLAEASTQPCPHCGGTGFIRSVESTALYVLRSIEEEGMRRRSAEICIYVPTNVALYILNQKRESLNQIEERYGVRVLVARDDALIPPAFRLERLRAYGTGEAPPLRTIQAPSLPDDEDEDEAEAEDAPETASEAAGEITGETEPDQETEEERTRRRRRRRRRRSDEPRDSRAAAAAPAVQEAETAEAEDESAQEGPATEGEEAGREHDRPRRRRGRRGGRVRGRRDEAENGVENAAENAAGENEPAGQPVGAETIEIVAFEEKESSDRDEAVPPAPWADEADLGADLLAPFAGESAAPVTVHERHPEHADVAAPPSAEAEEGVPFVGESERVLEEAGAESGHAPAAMHEAAMHEAAMHEAAMHEASMREAEPPPPVPPPPARPPEDIREITEKPANPRRGWWQRLIQS
jgi:ribonuclease E